MIKNIAIVAGGDSGEYEVSLKSGNQLFSQIDRSKYNPVLIHMKGMKWIAKIDGAEVDVDKNDFSVTFNGKKITFDCALVGIHGTPGEDGKLQSYFELIKLPYTTCGVMTSALTFNKFATKNYLTPYGINLAKGIIIHKNDKVNSSEIAKTLGLPCFVKPNNGGSSCGTSKIAREEDIEGAIKTALEHDDEIIVEEYIKGTEITCGVIKTLGRLQVLPIAEIVSKNEFFDFEAKYTSGMADEIIPARISKDIWDDCEKTSALIYEKLFCRGVVRMDYIIKDNKLYFLEVNTVPGMTEASIVPRMIKAVNIPMTQAITMLIEDALSRA
ncbi:MAG TPA: D-alanine--D-alanine ligase [Bacteroidales bacterium]|nr:D-alanine--D-alanine ligase [Bacteroidales bacterium]